MNSIRQQFETFHKEMYPDVGPTAVLALRRAFFAGYTTHAEHTLELLKTDDKQEMAGKTIALMMSVDSFQMDCQDQ